LPVAIKYKNNQDFDKMRESCAITASVLDHISNFVKPGISTEEIDKICSDFIKNKKAGASPLTKGFPKSVCTSRNHVVCHGVPSEKDILEEGDILNIDVSTYFNGFHGDTSETFAVGKISRKARELLKITYEALWTGIHSIKLGGYTGDIGYAISNFVEPKGYSIVMEYTGHGIGENIHEDPFILHKCEKGSGKKIAPGMAFTIEPMINIGTNALETLDDGWTVITKDKKLSAQWEHTIAIFDDHMEVFTARDSKSEQRIITF